MKRLQDKETTAENLEEKFDRGEEVLDYFEVTKARVINPRCDQSAIEGISRENKICVSAEAEFRPTRGGSRKISALSQ